MDKLKLTTLRLGGFLVGWRDSCWPPDLGPDPPMDRGLRGALGVRGLGQRLNSLLHTHIVRSDVTVPYIRDSGYAAAGLHVHVHDYTKSGMY